MTAKEKKAILNELEAAYYQAFSYRKRNAEVVSLQTAYHAEKLAALCRSIGLEKEVDITIEYVNKLVYGGNNK